MADQVKMVSTGKTKAGKRTGTFRVATRNKKTKTEKLKFKYYDKRAYVNGKVGGHVIFEETKIS